MKPLPCYGTTHADIFYGEVPCTAVMRDEQIDRDYEEETAVQILETFEHSITGRSRAFWSPATVLLPGGIPRPRPYTIA
jgi:L-ribulose-5-phosphate 4-epimerase